jgi:hypothetical protein
VLTHIEGSPNDHQTIDGFLTLKTSAKGRSVSRDRLPGGSSGGSIGFGERTATCMLGERGLGSGGDFNSTRCTIRADEDAKTDDADRGLRFQRKTTGSPTGP